MPRTLAQKLSIYGESSWNRDYTFTRLFAFVHHELFSAQSQIQ